MDHYYFQTEKLTVGYDGIPLIHDINIQLKKGEILTLVGPNGAGKTTILKSIIKQLEPLSGVVWMDQKAAKDFSRNEFAKIVSVVLTERIRPEMMSCRDVIGTGRYPYTGKFGILSETDWNLVDETMELVHISDLAQKDFMKISDGQRQRVLLARALCQQPEILILDEPTSFLDIRYKMEFLSILQKLSRKKNLTVIMSLHELDLAERVSDKIACIKGDKVDRFGNPDEIFSGGYIKELYQIREGSYDEINGSVELSPVTGSPKVFVIAGNGKGTAVFRRLQRQGIPFAAGILWENDLDYPCAKALAEEVISVKPFCQIDDETMNRAKTLMDRCEKVVCAVSIEEMIGFASDLKKLIQRGE